MITKLRLAILGLIALAVISPIQAIASIAIAYPPNNVIASESSFIIVGTSDETGVIRVEISGGSSVSGKEIPITNAGFAVKIKLNRGVGSIKLTSPSGQTASLQIAYGAKPAGFEKWNLHTYQDNFSNCTDCHRVSNKRSNYKRMAMGTESCRTGECHGEVGVDAEYVHGPAAGGVCISCHNPHGAKQKDFITRSGADQCYVCHENKQDEFNKSHQHTPVEDGNCTGCHDPHQSNHKYQLRGEGQDLCFRCHDAKDKTGGQSVHGPVEAGECDACHNPHASAFPYQLAAAGNDVCFECHEEKSEQMKLRHVHPPVEEDCSNCHDAHTGAGNAQLAENIPDLCWQCHSDLGELVAAATVEHPPVKRGECGKCHDFHASNQPLLMKKEMLSVCGSCHTDMEEHIAMEPNKHGPVKDNDCSACHTPHGGKNPRLLAYFFPPEFYNPYRENLYALCFQCHNADIARDANTTTLTNFRDGSRNLHYLHINKRKGRSCKACHEVHASDQAKHIRRSVPFGDLYEYPITFTKSQDGGSCVVGCHKPKSYSRLNRQ